MYSRESSLSISSIKTGLFYRPFPASDSNFIKFVPSSDDGTIHLWSIDTETKSLMWRLKDDGWQTGSNGDLLMWIPLDLCRALIYGPRTLNTGPSTRHHLSIYITLP